MIFSSCSAVTTWNCERLQECANDRQAWLFITDSADAVYREHDAPTALADRVASKLQISTAGHEDGHVTSFGVPMLEQKEIAALEDLQPFYSHLSLQTYESTYALIPPDLCACEATILRDLFT